MSRSLAGEIWDMRVEKTELEAFYRWNSGKLLENRTRGAFAEWLVHRVLGIQTEFREEWAEVDATTNNGTTIEIKAAAYEQSWEQSKPSVIGFDIKQKVSHLYIFCLMEGRQPEDLSQWTFWVVPTAKLPDQKRISLDPLKKRFGEGIAYEQIKDVVQAFERELA